MNINARGCSAIVLGCLALILCTQGAAQQTNDKPPAGNQSPPRLRVASNLVVVRVVVTDAQGKPVEGLQKGDFNLFDQGEAQSIMQFEVASSVAPPTSSVAVRAPGSAAPPPPPALPGKFLALYFDVLNTSDTDIIYARDAADHYLSADLQPQDRVAIFTSEQMLSDFTSDPKQLHEALFKLHASSRSLNLGTMNCPDLSDYEALQITQNSTNQNSDAWKLAIDEAAHCGDNPQPPPQSSTAKSGASGKGGGSASASSLDQPIVVSQVLNVAFSMVNQIEIQARSNLQQIDQVVKYVSQMPGQRTVILISPGFLSQSQQDQLYRIIDHALRSQVVISSLDPRGLAILMRESDASQGQFPSSSGGALTAAHRVDSAREFVATSVLAEVAQGTGGEFFHNNNDLNAGLGALAGSPVSYILAFAPTDLKPDGKFHALKVTLAGKHPGFSIQARRGYFAPKKEAEGETQAKEREPADAGAQVQEQIREAMLSKTDIAQFPVGLDVKISEGQGGTRELSLSTHLDAQPLHFHKEGEHNLNTVLFCFTVFDQKENLLETQLRQAKVDVPDGQLPAFFKVGVDVNLTFHLKPGIYRLREVVTESVEHHMTAFSRNVDISSVE